MGKDHGIREPFLCGRFEGPTVEVVEVRFFGEFEVVLSGVVVQVRGTKQRALLALLALHRGKPVAADRLIDALWEEGRSTNPANALQAQIGQLRRTLGSAAILTTEAGYALAVDPDDMDGVRFEQLVAKGRRLLGEGDVEKASTTLAEALQLRRGEPLAEFAYAGFADAERAHLDELTLVALEASAGAELARAGTERSSASWRRSVENIRFESVCGSCSSSPCTGTDGRPRPCGPTARSAIVWSTSWGSTPGEPW